MLEHLEDCNEDANQTDCIADCEYDPTYAWCANLERCDMEVRCCKEECEANYEDDEDNLESCEEDCDFYGGSCRASPTHYWAGTSNLACKMDTC